MGIGRGGTVLPDNNGVRGKMGGGGSGNLARGGKSGLEEGGVLWYMAIRVKGSKSGNGEGTGYQARGLEG